MKEGARESGEKVRVVGVSLRRCVLVVIPVSEILKILCREVLISFLTLFEFE